MDNQIAWQNDEDMKHFRSYTEVKVVVMGRKTLDSLPVKPLLMRENWVLCDTRTTPKTLAKSFNGIEEVVEYADFYSNNDELPSNELCIIGGQSIYEQFMPYATDLVITRIKGDYQCDRFFPVIDLNVWQRYDIDVKDTCRIEYYKRK